jgi:glycerol kinase
MKAVLAIDQGTTGTTCLVIDERGEVRGRAYAELPQHYPSPGWVEHDAEEVWASVLYAGRAALAAAGASGPAGAGGLDVACIGITNQRETVVLWDRRTGEPVHRAVVWQDRRTAARCRELKAAGTEAMIRRRTGLVLDPYFSATKLEWLLREVPHARARAERGELAFGTVDAWVVWRLTDGRVHATDPTNASRTLLYDIGEHAWSGELLALFGVPRAVLPEVRPSSGSFGEASAAHFGRALPIAGVAGDQQAALYGQACWLPGEAKNTYGTGAFLLLHTGDRRVTSRSGLLATVACGARGERAYALEGSIFIAGAAVQWLRDGLGLIETAQETAELAASLTSNDGVYFVPAFVGLGAPHWDPDARGTIVGLTRGSTRAHLARATLEAMAYATRDVLEAMVADSGVRLAELAVDGGAAANDWLMQFQADVLNVPIRRPRLVETTALGAAGLAGLAAGVWQDPEDFVAVRPAPTIFEPAMPVDTRGALVAGWQRAVVAARVWSGGLQAAGAAVGSGATPGARVPAGVGGPQATIAAGAPQGLPEPPASQATMAAGGAGATPGARAPERSASSGAGSGSGSEWASAGARAAPEPPASRATSAAAASGGTPPAPASEGAGISDSDSDSDSGRDRGAAEPGLEPPGGDA